MEQWCSDAVVQRCEGVQILRCRCGAEEVQQLCSGADIEVQSWCQYGCAEEVQGGRYSL